MRSQFESELLRIEFVFTHYAVLQFANHGRCAEGNFVETILAPYHHDVVGAEPLHDVHLDADQVGMEHAHQGVRRAGRIGERAEDVEEGAHAQFLAHRCHVLHGRVMIGREHETHAGRLQAFGHLRRREIDLHAERFQHVG